MNERRRAKLGGGRSELSAAEGGTTSGRRPMKTLLVDRRDGIVTVTMNRPQKKNAVTTTMTDELIAVFREVARSQEDRVLVLTGAGGDFSSGADLTDSASLTASGLVYMRRISELALALHAI